MLSAIARIVKVISVDLTYWTSQIPMLLIYHQMNKPISCCFVQVLGQNLAQIGEDQQ